ncbi:haloalkane dehalogenase [Zhongshania sp.]|jgi:haloalkane dehalogenase|uniref:haloalkane dehalogenase n=1 Tax=Zhongshania sp. TaxID=1971902 RepID=UPI0039E351BF
MTDFLDQYPYPKQYKTIHGKRMAYIDQGSGDPIVFLHGNPTSSYLWRNIMPYLEGRGRLIAPDLIGMGDSEKLDNTGPESYSYAEHQTYLYALLDELGVKENVTLVVHDWGSGLGFHWAKMNAHGIKGIAFMEAIVAPVSDWASFPEDAVELFKGFRSEAGEVMILDDNLFIEFVLPSMIMRTMTSAEMDEYRRPFARAGEYRRPTLTWPRQLPIAGEPEDVVQAVSAYSTWLSQTEIPKLFVNADPGALISGAVRDYVRSWRNLSEVTVAGLHFIQEDSPHEIGRAIADWHSDLG